MIRILIGNNTKNVMRSFAFYIGMATMLVASCSVKEENFVSPQQDDIIFYASFEQPSEGTRVYANEDLLLRWTADDRVSIFNKNTYNQQYKFTGSTGDNAGEFSKIEGADFVTGNAISNVVSVYPYQEDTEINENETLTLTLPAEQHYAENTFGLGANTMVSVSADNFLQFKNVGGYLRLSLYGNELVYVSSITLRGNNGEKLAGKANVTMPLDGVPTMEMMANSTEEITLVCDEPVILGVSETKSVDFWFVVPPVTFSKGFTISITQTNGGVYEKTTSNSVSIERSKLSKMSKVAIDKVTPSWAISFADETVKQKMVAAFDTNGDGELSYEEAASVSDGVKVKEAFGSTRTYKSFDEFQYFTGVTSIPYSMFYDWTCLTSIMLPNQVTTIGRSAFRNCSNLVSIVLPDSLTMLSDDVFWECSSLTSITLPNSVTTIGNCAFMSCSSLINITLPESITSISDGCFGGCASLDGIIIPKKVKSIGTEAFLGCSSLTSITIPESVTTIGEHAFESCLGLTSITIPKSVLSIGDYAFIDCSSIESITVDSKNPVYDSRENSNSIIEAATNVLVVGCKNSTIPESVTRIGNGAFCGSIGITSITLPESLTAIGDDAFSGCTGLANIAIPESVRSIGNGTFTGCTSLSSITMPNDISSIGSYSFYNCSSLTSISIPEKVTSVEAGTFMNCTRLTSIIIPQNVTSIGNSALFGCSKLTSITVLPETPPTGGSEMFKNTNNAPIYVPSGSVDAYKTADVYWKGYASRIQAIQE